MKRRGCKKDGRVQVFLDGLCEGNSWGRIAGGRQMDREGARGEACEQKTDGGEGNCRRTVLNLISAYAPQAGTSWKTCRRRKNSSPYWVRLCQR